MLTVTGLLTALAVVPLIWIIGYTIVRGGAALNLSFITQSPRPLGMAGGGVLSAIEGTIVLTLLAALFAIPPGILAAVYTAYHPGGRFATVVGYSTDVLAGVPSIVVGLFCYEVIVVPQGHYSAYAGGISLAIIMFPYIVRTTEEMLKLVPRNLHEGALALGSPDWRSVLSVTLPAAITGIITGVVLALARAAGETAPLLFTALGNENYSLSRIVSSGAAQGKGPLQIVGDVVGQPVDSLSLTLFKYAQQPYPERIEQAWGAALVLMAVVLVINIIARSYVQYRSRQMRSR